MPNKLTDIEVRRRLKELYPSIEIIDKYTNTRTKMNLICHEHDYEWTANWKTLQNHGCPVCSGKSLTLDIVKEKLKKINSNIEILSKEYNGSKSKLRCKCLIDGNEWLVNWANLQNKRGCPECKSRKLKEPRFSIEEIRERAIEKDENIIILSDEYINNTTPMKFYDKSCGHSWTMTWNGFLNSTGCKICAKERAGEHFRLNLEEVLVRLSKISPNLKIIDSKYIDARTGLKTECQICGHIWHPVWSSLNSGSGCPICAGRYEYTMKDIKRMAYKINPNIEILGDDYKNNREKFDCKCKIDGYQWESNWIHIQRGSGCPKCGGRPSYNIEDIIIKMSEINPTIKILSKEYVNANTKISVECKLCGRKFKSNWMNLQQGSGCSNCNGGWYSKQRAERHKEEWLEIPAKLYLIKCTLDKEEFFKVGVTKRSMKARFKDSNMPYNIEVIKIISTNLYKVSYLESELISTGKDKKIGYKPNIRFDGHTECFDYRIIEYYEDIERRILYGCK